MVDRLIRFYMFRLIRSFGGSAGPLSVSKVIIPGGGGVRPGSTYLINKTIIIMLCICFNIYLLEGPPPLPQRTITIKRIISTQNIVTLQIYL